MRANVRKSGFTLPEVIVTITLIAALAAVVVPAVANQLKKGDPSRVASDAQAIRGAVEQFLTDVRRYPKSFGQLTNQITTNDVPLASTFTGTLKYLSGDSIRWKGPYMTKDSIAAQPTGFGWKFATAFSVDTLDVSGVSGSSTGIRYMTLRAIIPQGAGNNDATLLDQLYDDGNVLTGSYRWRSGTTFDTLKILLLPIS